MSEETRTEDVDLAPLGEIERLALAQRQNDVLALEDYFLRRLLFAEPAWHKTVLGNNEPAEKRIPGDQSDPFSGIYIDNPNPIAINVGFGPGGAQLGVAIAPYSWRVLPQRFADCVIGLANPADAAGPAYTVATARLRVPPNPNGGPSGQPVVKGVAIDTAANGNTAIVAAVPGRRITVVSYALIVGANVNAKFTDGAGGTELTGPMPLAANGGLAPQAANVLSWLFQGSVNTALVLNLSAAIQASGHLTYFEA